MGREVEKIAESRGHTISAIVNSPGDPAIGADVADVAIEFTEPSAAVDNFSSLMQSGLPVVTGTTGWYRRIDEVRDLVELHEGSFLYASNFSIGVNILFQLNQRLTQLMNPYDSYDVFVEERHHRHKKDAPSGTAESLAGQILAGLDRKSRMSDAELRHRSPEADELSVAYTRAGEITGFHEVSYISETDKLSISHEAYNRGGFALGAVVAAEWLHGKKGFYNFSDIFA